MRITAHRHTSLPPDYRYLKFCYYVPAIVGTFSCHLLSEVGEPWQAEAKQMLRELGLDPDNLEARDIDEEEINVSPAWGAYLRDVMEYLAGRKPTNPIHYANVFQVRSKSE